MKKGTKKLLSLLLIMSMMLTMSIAPIYAEPTSLTVIVLDAITNAPVENADVILQGNAAVLTDVQGIATVSVPENGNYALTIRNQEGGYLQYNGLYEALGLSEEIQARLYKSVSVTEVTTGVTLAANTTGETGYTMTITRDLLPESVRDCMYFQVTTNAVYPWNVGNQGLPQGYEGGAFAFNMDAVTNIEMPAAEGTYTAALMFFNERGEAENTERVLVGYTALEITVLPVESFEEVPINLPETPTVGFDMQGEPDVLVAIQEGVYTYDIDIPAGSKSFELVSNLIEVGTIDNVRLNVHGTSTQSDLDVFSFNADDKCAVITAHITTATGVEKFTFNLFQPGFEGVIVTPNVIAGNWGSYIYSFGGGSPSNVFLGATEVDITLPQVSNNTIESLVIEGLAPDLEDPNHYTVTLSNSASNSTELTITGTLKDGTVIGVFPEPPYWMTITKRALSSGSYGDGTGTFNGIVTYTAHESYQIPNAKMLVVYYYEDVETGNRKTLRAKTFDFVDSDLNTPEIEVVVLPEGDIRDTSERTPNTIGVFLIEGNVSLESESFGGVKFGEKQGGKGIGWFEMFPNHPALKAMFEQIFPEWYQ